MPDTIIPESDYHVLNAMLTVPDEHGGINFDADRHAVRQYFLDNINKNTVFFHSVRERLKYLVTEGYYEPEVLAQYSHEFIESVFKHAYSKKFRFRTLKGAVKFFTGYALKTFDKTRIIERYEDRLCMVALTVGNGNEAEVLSYLEELITQRLQPATPTFSNAGKKQRGELVSCYLMSVSDDRESISRAWTAAFQLSARGGGVAFCLTDLRGQGSPIKRVKGVGSGIIPMMKVLDGIFSYANQLGSRDGSGVIYISVCHPDVKEVLDCRRENADASVRIKALMIGLMVPDIVYVLAEKDEDYYTFEPYDVMAVYGIPLSRIDITKHYQQMVDDPRITKTKINARWLFTEIARIQTESGVPYIINEDVVNRANPIHGYINQSNLCVEILQTSTDSSYLSDLTYTHVGEDIQCNLASLNAVKCIYGPDFGHTVQTSTRFLTNVSMQSSIDCVPSIRQGNENGHAIGLGVMNWHGLLAREHMYYGSPESIELTDLFFATLNYHSIVASCHIARERGHPFVDFNKSKYATGEYFERYINTDWTPKDPKVIDLFRRTNFHVPTQNEWAELSLLVQKHGLFNRYRLAVAPTGSVSYINDSTASISPIADKIEARKEGSDGLMYYPAPEMTDDNQQYFENAYEVGYEKTIDVCSAASKHVDQGISMTLFFPAGTSTQTINQAQIYARKKNIKTIYYTRVAKMKSGLSSEPMAGECVACAV